MWVDPLDGTAEYTQVLLLFTLYLKGPCQAVLRSRHFFGRLRLRKSEVPEPTLAPTKLGRLRLHAKKGGLQAAPAPNTKICNF